MISAFITVTSQSLGLVLGAALLVAMGIWGAVLVLVPFLKEVRAPDPAPAPTAEAAKASQARMDEAPAPTWVSLGNVSYSIVGRQAFVGDREVPLSPIEHDLLRFFLEHPNEAVSKQALQERFWGCRGPDTRAVEEANLRLRKKLQAAGSTATNEVVRGYGYKFTVRD